MSTDEAIQVNTTFSEASKQAVLVRLLAESSLATNLAQILERGLKIIIEATRAEVGEIFLFEGEPDSPEEQRFFRQVILQAPPELKAAFSEATSFEYGEGFPGLAASTHWAIFSDKLISDKRFLRQGVKRLGFEYGLACPLLANGQAIGSLDLFGRADKWQLQPQDLPFVKTLAASLAMAINSILSYERLGRARIGMTALSNAVEILNSSLNPTYVLARLLSEAVRLVEADGGAVYLYSPGQAALQPAATILIEPTWRERILPLAGSLAAEVLLTGTVRTVPDTSLTPERKYPALEDSGPPGAVVAAPLIRQNEIRGVLECYNVRPRSYSKEQLDLLAALASHAGLALRNAEMHQEIRQERSLVEVERKKLRAILDSSPEGLLFALTDGTVLDFNQSGRSILELGDHSPRNIFNFERDYEIYQPDGILRPSQDIALLQALNQGETVVLQESILRWADGREKHLLLSAAPICDETGQRTGAFTLFQDVTHLKQAERVKSKFLSMITHELKTPLASIKGTVSGLLQEDVEWDEATQKRFLHSIEDDVDGMVSLVANLLDMARLEAGFMLPELEECYLSEIVEEAARKLRGLASAARQHIEFEFDLTTPPVAADFTLLERVLINLINNALKYSPNDTTVSVSVRPAHDGELVELAVADRGPGITNEERELIFKQFYRGQQVAGRAGRKVGTGLGLAICREVIAMHGGDIWVEEREGGGSVFKFTLPALEAEN